MFDFEVTHLSNNETKAELVSDDTFYCLYIVANGTASQINAYVSDLRSFGLLRRDFNPYHQGVFFWGGPYSIFYGEAK
jgi:hypothetical protein